jgi:hypothetical protein
VNPIEAAISILESSPPISIADAKLKLQALLTACRVTIEQKMAATKSDTPTQDLQAQLSDIGVVVEAVEAVTGVIADLVKAQESANNALDRAMKKLNSTRLEQRIWAKLRPKTETQQ